MTDTASAPKSKLTAGLLGILLPFGVHKFYLGDTQGGVIRLLVALTCVGMWWSFIEGILILVNGGKDAAGNDLV